TNRLGQGGTQSSSSYRALAAGGAVATSNGSPAESNPRIGDHKTDTASRFIVLRRHIHDFRGLRLLLDANGRVRNRPVVRGALHHREMSRLRADSNTYTDATENHRASGELRARTK